MMSVKKKGKRGKKNVMVDGMAHGLSWKHALRLNAAFLLRGVSPQYEIDFVAWCLTHKRFHSGGSYPLITGCMYITKSKPISLQPQSNIQPIKHTSFSVVDPGEKYEMQCGKFRKVFDVSPFLFLFLVGPTPSKTFPLLRAKKKQTENQQGKRFRENSFLAIESETKSQNQYFLKMTLRKMTRKRVQSLPPSFWSNWRRHIYWLVFLASLDGWVKLETN